MQRDLTSRLAQRTYENLTWNLPVAPWSSSLPSLKDASWEIARGYLEETEVHRVASQAYYGLPEETGSII
ncbi:hypothetical protein L6258_00560, partial [Candidatus Parcubacteria bacterium]|nr:hypothetical protein [Candidatus Parcubacteria bacterium]